MGSPTAIGNSQTSAVDRQTELSGAASAAAVTVVFPPPDPVLKAD